MDAERFAITTPYGQVPGYELNNGWHRGEDRAMPMDTPVLVNGHEIGLSGNSGYVTGPHLHIGRFVGGSDTPPNGGGFHFNQALVTEIGEDATNGKFVRVQADGASWVYLHLSRQLVAVGQELIRPPAPQPATAIPTPATYQVVETYPGGKQVRLNKQPTNLWGMNYHFDYMKNHPVEVHDNGEIWTITNKVHHEDGYDYYRRDGQVDGFNVLDCDDYTPPPPPPAPPAAPVEVKRAEKYTLVTTVMYFSSASDASMHNDAKGTLKPGDYFVFGTNGKAYNLSTDNMKDQQTWVNSNDNVIEVVQPTPIAIQPATPVQDVEPATDTVWKPQYAYLRSDKRSIKFVGLNKGEYIVKDHLGKLPDIYMDPHAVVYGVDSFIGQDGRKYVRWPEAVDKQEGYGIPRDMLEYEEFYVNKTRAMRLATNTANLADKAFNYWVKMEKNMKFLDGIKSVFAGINQGKRK